MALLQINGTTEFSLLASLEVPYSVDLREQVLTVCQHQQASLLALGQLKQALSLAYADAVNQLLAKQHIKPNQVTAIGCHGQTVCHAPDANLPFSMQLVDPSQIVAKTGIACITDFRAMDMALGGQGAPLIPLFHQQLFSNIQSQHAKVLLNIGGIANISRIHPEPLIGFDTGPGNILLDGWIAHCQGKTFDNNGEFAQSGSVHQPLLDHLLADEYFQRPAPKSTGREYFNLAWLMQKLSEFEQATVADADIMATLVALTAQSVVNALPNEENGELLVFGGGARNQALMTLLALLKPNWQLSTTEQIGIDADFMEAAAFAWLAYACVNNVPGNAPEVTGASRAAVSGLICR